MATVATDATRPANVPAALEVDFDFHDVAGPEADFFAEWQAFQRRAQPADVVWTARHGGHWIVVDGELVHALYADHQRLSNRIMRLPHKESTFYYIPVQSEPPMHAAYRAAVNKGFAARHIIAARDTIRDQTRELIAAFRDKGRCEFVNDFAELMPFGVFLTLNALPLGDRGMLRDVGTQLARPRDLKPDEVFTFLVDYLRPHVLARLEQPGDDLISRILKEPIDGRAWTMDEAIRMSVTMLVAGLDTVASLMGFAIHFLASSAAHQAQIRETPKIIPAAADELLRRFGMVSNFRVANFDFPLGEVTIKAGDILMLPTMMHNLDARAFDDPMSVDFRRGLCRHSTMGNGAHRCVGASLAREEMIIFLEEWFAAIPAFSIDPTREVRLKWGSVGTLTSLPLCWDI